MIVYGDTAHEVSAASMLAAVGELAQNSRAASLDGARALLIQTGQLEQALHDAGDESCDPTPVRSSERVTDSVAAVFASLWARAAGVRQRHHYEPSAALADATHHLAQIEVPSSMTFHVKVPEGFEFYALFPEQYCVSALKWAADHASVESKRALIIGIRSIGTTLSALVAAVLRNAGWQCERLTVRPTGHPFTRTVRLPPFDSSQFNCALIVDEGPGISGSSMASVADALATQGIRDVSFLPGHSREPGFAASAEIRRRWAQTPRYVASLAELTWNGVSLAQSLAQKTSELFPSDPVVRVEDVSGGLWRAAVYRSETDWPACPAAFERMKFLCTQAGGDAVLWKFAGLGCLAGGTGASAESLFAQLSTKAQAGWCPEPLALHRGFIAMRWIDGRRLSKGDAADAAVLDHIGRYLAATAGPPLPAAAAERAHSRLADLLFLNTKEALGDEWAARARARAGIAIGTGTPGYTDGHMAPHEWIRTRAGQLLKTDAAGHDCDHTVIGSQPLLWDIAGTMIEWDIDWRRGTPLLSPIQARGIAVDRDALHFHECAYAAFRLGLHGLCAEQAAADSAERARLQRAADFYRDKLLERLTAPAGRPREARSCSELARPNR
jgi:hypothetical protein